jgi:hypothetical protein
MMTSISYFVKSEGIRLPDGTVWGGGVELKYSITHGEDFMDTFKIFEHIGKDRIRISDLMRYKEMKEWLMNTAKHYKNNGMELWAANHSDWDKATYKTIVDENY